uniref:Uncharacterized protein n=1 Tax=Octopus bimaculoides TaxID=37653 RepID=A0A0L8H0D9_OCTBM
MHILVRIYAYTHLLFVIGNPCLGEDCTIIDQKFLRNLKIQQDKELLLSDPKQCRLNSRCGYFLAVRAIVATYFLVTTAYLSAVIDLFHSRCMLCHDGLD